MLALILIAAVASFSISRGFSSEASSGVPITGLSLPSIGAAPASEPVLAAPVLPDTILREEIAPALTALADDTEAGNTARALSAQAAATVAEAAPAAEPFTLYAVQEGDTAGGIAAAAGIDLQYLLWANADLRDGDLVSPGQFLVIPTANGTLYDVRIGDTLSAIAVRYGVDVEDIIGWGGNGILSVDDVIEDTLLFIPNGIPPIAILPVEQPPAVEAPIAVTAPPPVPAPAPPAPVIVDPGPISGVGSPGRRTVQFPATSMAAIR